MAETNSARSLIDVKDAELVNFDGSNTPFRAKSYFLKPTSSISSYLPLLFDYKSSDFKPPNYSGNFRWWAEPPDDYVNWVDKLAPKFNNIWKKTGIFEAIMASKHRIRQEPITLATFCQFWSEDTNTFAFPWGEATITLEDVMILGNFPVLGEPLNVVDELSEGALSDMERRMEQEMESLKNKLNKRNIHQSSWMHHYLESSKGDEVEHVAFLTYWLSKFVLISSRRGIDSNLFKVAVRLACGVKVALGYPVLASIYTFLSVMNQYIRSCSTSTLCCMMWAPMNIFQVWVWERFPSLRPKVKILTSVDMPRVTRWTMKGPIYDNLSVIKVIESRDEFIWRPYVMDLENWIMPSFYADDYGTWYECNASLDEGLISYARCLSTCKLVGLSCVKQYHPHRVAMQFGLSQDIPLFIHPTNEDASENIDMNSSNLMFYVAPRLCKSYVTSQYHTWWKRIEVNSVVPTRKRKRTKKRKGNMLDSYIRKKFFARSDAMLTVKRDLDSKPNVSDVNENNENGHLDGNEKENIDDLSIMGESFIVNKNHLEPNINKEIDISAVKKGLKGDHMKINQLKDLDPKPNELDANKNKENGHQNLLIGESIMEHKNHLSNEEMDISTVNKESEVDYREINQLQDLHPKPNVLDANENRENGCVYASMIENNILDGDEKENINGHQDLSMIEQLIAERKNNLKLYIDKVIGNSTWEKKLEEDQRKINQLKEEIKIIEEKIELIESQSQGKSVGNTY